MTLRISERAAESHNPLPPRAPASFADFIIKREETGRTITFLHKIIDGKPPKQAVLAILAAARQGVISMPTYASVRREFPNIGSRPNFTYYVSRQLNYTAEMDSVAKALTDL